MLHIIVIALKSEIVAVTVTSLIKYSYGNNYCRVSDFGENNETKKFTGEGDLILEWGTPGTGDGRFVESDSVAVDKSTDYVFVLDHGKNRVQKFDTNENFVTRWGSGDK